LDFPPFPIEIGNIGGGPAFNIHGILHGSSNRYDEQFISWNNGPIGKEKDEKILFRHPFDMEFRLSQASSVNGEHTLYYPFYVNKPNPNDAQATLTLFIWQ
jgi:hypothetical protein